MPASRSEASSGSAAGVAQRAALAQEIPEPVELDPDALELVAQRRDRLGLFGQLTLAVTQLSLAILERLDLGLDLLVVHGAMVRDGASPGESAG